jgi:hypothetical protein
MIVLRSFSELPLNFAVVGYFDLTRENSQKKPTKKIHTVTTSHVNGLARAIGSHPTDPACDDCDRDRIEIPTTTTMTSRIAAANTASNPARAHLT